MCCVPFNRQLCCYINGFICCQAWWKKQNTHNAIYILNGSLLLRIWTGSCLNVPMNEETLPIYILCKAGTGLSNRPPSKLGLAPAGACSSCNFWTVIIQKKTILCFNELCFFSNYTHIQSVNYSIPFIQQTIETTLGCLHTVGTCPAAALAEVITHFQ